MVPGSLQGLQLVVEDIQAARGPTGMTHPGSPANAGH